MDQKHGNQENMKRGLHVHFIHCGGEDLKVKWTDRITNDEVFQRAKEERLF
jgi:hypothetical protein